jgi:hypothetical protein
LARSPVHRVHTAALIPDADFLGTLLTFDITRPGVDVLAAIRAAVADYAATPDGATYVARIHGDFNFGDLDWIPADLWHRHGLRFVALETILDREDLLIVSHDERRSRPPPLRPAALTPPVPTPQDPHARRALTRDIRRWFPCPRLSTGLPATPTPLSTVTPTAAVCWCATARAAGPLSG